MYLIGCTRQVFYWLINLQMSPCPSLPTQTSRRIQVYQAVLAHLQGLGTTQLPHPLNPHLHLVLGRYCWLRGHLC